MPAKKPLQRKFRIYRRGDGRFVTCNEHPGDNPLGVDNTLYLALGSAIREANMAAREGARVVIEVQQADGKFKRQQIIGPFQRS